MADDETKLTYQCGHTAKQPRFRGDPAAQTRQLIHQTEKLASLLCTKCHKKKYAAENAAAATANQKRGLPRLRGTENEIAWAEKLRSDFFTELVKHGVADADARGACVALDAWMWIHLHKQGFAGAGLLGEFQRWAEVVESNRAAGLPELEILAASDSEVQLIEDKRLRLGEVGKRLGLEHRAVIEAMKRLKTDLEWLELVQLNDELCLVLLQHEQALNSYLELLHRSAAIEEHQLLSEE